MENEKDFKNFVYNNICQCYNQCIDLKYGDIQNKTNICTEISTTDNNPPEFYDKIINNALNFFINEKYLVKLNKYYIITPEFRLKLSWENIKHLPINLQKLFWLLRKLIIDSLLKKITLNFNNKIKIFSVGSTNLSSDYDITLYGQTKYKIKTMNSFKSEFIKLFKEDSSIVFDTNIYGKSYISFDKIEFGNFGKAVESCGPEFYYLQENPLQYSQLIWGIIKYFRDIRDSLGENIYNDLYNFMYKYLEMLPIKKAHDILIFLRNRDSSIVNYNNLFKMENIFKKKYIESLSDLMENSDIELLALHDYISIINFYGTETYFTRGAFIDIVINKQMCNNDNFVPLELTQIDYITSILENAGFFFTHSNKLKYINRVYNTLLILIEKNTIFSDIPNDKSFIRLAEIITNGEDKYCKWTSNKELNLLKCEKFELFGIIFKLMCKILKPLNNQKQNMPFYDIYVTGTKTREFGSPLKKIFFDKSDILVES